MAVIAVAVASVLVAVLEGEDRGEESMAHFR